MASQEIFQNLERQTGAEAVLESLGEASGEYKSLSTNSKSGERLGRLTCRAQKMWLNVRSRLGTEAG